MKTPEGRVADFLRCEARRRGLFIRKCVWEGRVGCPDYLVIHDGRAFFIEAKAPGEKPRPSQVAEFERLRSAGASVAVVDSAQAAGEALDRIGGAGTFQNVRWDCAGCGGSMGKS